MVPDQAQIADLHPVLSTVATLVSVIAAAILIWYLVRRPPLDATTKLRLLFGLGILPAIAMLTGNMGSLMITQHREFCGSCHVMTPYAMDSADPDSESLAARHARNALFGHQNCYTCHKDYGMFGAVMTKVNGMRHVWEYYTEYRHYTVDEAYEKMHLYKPFSNTACMNCHSMTLKSDLAIEDHRGLLDEIRSGEASCVSSGCHGHAHPFSKDEDEQDDQDDQDPGRQPPDGQVDGSPDAGGAR
jgi:nitrate/TMAO reductase-like tetraheme cytochrome c subunit